MIFETHVPSAPLSDYVDNIVFYEGFNEDYTKEKLLPDGSINVILDMQDTPKKWYDNNDFSKYKELKGCFISGQHKGFIHIEVAKNASMMVIRFKPGGAYPFLDFPVSRLNDSVEQLEEFWGPEVETLRKGVRAEKELSKKFCMAEEFLLLRMKVKKEKDAQLKAVLQVLQQEPFQVTTVALAAKAGISQKHLISLFDKYVGLTPKLLARIYRFQKVLLQIEETKKIEWLQVACDCGYYDQAHFVKDFYHFSGINPSQYLTQKGVYLNYIPVNER